ncbi:hypothetical protein JTE90_021260 [Oedothorax gibbosus]|uniref:Uncharacterized protein n=1 Tax=Oedothorax gibbosus TaxID=931172 RepID=A0AAV6U0E3_9ARAC|nr:hypothetical protein JTE90_021260 [Oedothorax gibbosus]
MDVGLDIRFLFGPYATAFAAGALFAFCMALIKERYKPKRRDSAPESSVRNPEPEFPDETESAGLTKYSSMGSLCDTKTLEELEFVPRSVPCISNFPAFDGGKTVTGIGGLPCIAKLRSFTFSDDLISLERRFMRYCDGFETPKSHSYSLPNFQGSRSQPFVLGSVYHQFQSPRRRSRFLGFCNWKPFQQGRKTVSLECPKLPVVYDPNVLTKAAKAVLRNNFRGMESLVLQKGKSLPCLPFKHINMEKSNYDTKCPDAVHRSVDFPPTNSELIEYLSSDQDSNFSETLSQDSDITTKYQNLHSYDKVCQERITISEETENKWDNFTSSDIIKTFENFAADPNDIENKKMGLDTQRNSNKATQNFSHYKEDKILQSYMEIINCSKKLTEFYEKEMSVFEGDVNFLKLKHENINLKTKKKKCQGLGKINEKGHKSSYREKQKFSEEISFELKNSYPGNENNLISNNFSMSNNSFVKNACPSTENAIRSEKKTEYSKNQNPCSEEKANDQAPSEFPCALESSFSGGLSEPALRNCHNTGVRIEEEKSINSGIHNLGKIQIRKADEDPKVKKEFLLSLCVQQRRTREHFAGKPLVTNDRDVTGGGGGRGGRAAADDSGREEKRQMDRGTRARSVGGWEVVCAPGRVFESNVSSETVDGVTTTIVSSVSSTTDPWSDIVDATFYDAVDNMSVRTVITTTDGQYRTSQGAPVEHIYVQDKVVVSPTRAAFRIRKQQEQPSVSDKCVPAPYRSNGISHNNDGQAPSDPRSPQDKCTASPVRPTRLKGGKQTPSPVLSPTGTTKPAIPAKPPHLVRGPMDPPYRPHYEEYMAEGSVAAPPEGRPLLEGESSPPRVSRLLGLLSRDEERRKKASIGGEEKEEWDSILSGVLASVSELEKVAKDVGGGADEEDAAEEERDQSAAMDEEAQTVPKEETPTKIKSLRFKLDPDIFDVPSDDSFYDDDVEDEGNMRGWRTRYKVGDEPVRLVSVQASVVPAGQKMTVARPVGIDLRVRLTTEGGKRAHTSPLQQAKRRSPVSDRGWCQELSPVTENVDWRDTFTPNGNSTPSEGAKPVPNGILKTPSPKSEGVAKDSVNPFKEEAKSNGVHADEKQQQQQQQPPKPNGMTHWNPPQKKFSLPRKKFEPDPEAVDRITGYKTAVAKPPLPPPVFLKVNTPPTTRNRAEIARKQYLMDNKAALSASPKPDGSRKFQQFLAQAQSDRERLVTSVPDLAAIEKAVHEKWAREKGSRASPAREDSRLQPDTPSSRGSTPDDAWSSYVQTCRKHLGRRSQSMSYLETDVDLPPVDEDKWSSTTALDHPDSDHPTTVDDSSDFGESQEDLNDSGRAKSEHELRIQRSLQSLPLPDWYKRSDKPKTGFLLKSSERKEKRGWAAAKSLASSTSSLASCGVKRPVHSLRSSRENIPWSRSSPSPDGPALSLALSRAFREPYMGWRARTSTTSSGVSSSPNSSWCGGRSTTDEEAIHGISFDGEDVDCLGKTTSSEEGGRRDEPPSPDDTGADAATVSMDTGDLIKLPGGEDTCDDINNMSMDTCELFDAGIVMDELPSIVLAPGGESSPQADTGDDIDNLSTDTTTDSKRKDTPWKDTTTDSLSKVNGGTVDSYSIRRDTDSISQSGKCPSTGNMSDSVHSRSNGSSKDPKSKRYSYSRSIYHSEWGEEESRGDRKGRAHKDPSPTSPDSKVIWIESSFVGSRTTTSIVVLPQGRESKVEGDCVERPASR